MMTNPAGIAELGMEKVWFDMSPGFINPEREINGTESDSDFYFVPSGAIALKLNERLYLGFGLGALAGLGVDFDDALSAPGNQQFVSTKGLFRFGPNIAYRMDDRLTLGASLNIGYQSLALSTPGFDFPQNQKFGLGVSLGAVRQQFSRGCRMLRDRRLKNPNLYNQL